MKKLLIILTTFTKAFASLPNSFQELNERNIQVLRLEVTSPLFQLDKENRHFLEQEFIQRKWKQSLLEKAIPLFDLKPIAKIFLDNLNQSNKKIEGLFADKKKNELLMQSTKDQNQLKELNHTQQLIEMKIENEIDIHFCPTTWNFLYHAFSKQINPNSEFTPNKKIFTDRNSGWHILTKNPHATSDNQI